MERVKRALEVAEFFRSGSLGAYWDAGRDKTEKIDAATDHHRTPTSLCQAVGSDELVDDYPKSCPRRRKMVELIRTSHFDDVGVCFDLGTCAHWGRLNRPPDFEIVRGLVRSTNVHDKTAGAR